MLLQQIHGAYIGSETGGLTKGSIDESFIVLGDECNVHRTRSSMVVFIGERWSNKNECRILVGMKIKQICRVQHLIAALNEILANDTVDEAGLWKKKLTYQSLELFDFLPQAIQEQLLLERDPHGNVQVAKIETKKMVIEMAETELGKRKQEGKYTGEFKGQTLLVMKVDVGCQQILMLIIAMLLVMVGNLCAPVKDLTVGGTALTSLMDVERRHGKFKPVIKKAVVELEDDFVKREFSEREV
ncbi:pyrophosphate--fructose 6-phosphate 1-phosphotransferase subunit beta-like [Vicia villosa]|uniref:pyrophosphate--fructose 6-phosphate 1-phosphotransferase subunit beta-like n=1 Tax=Vicia villosa TaxID=3911 RepID=UPI00273B97D7|nr:pyrophosphate--fructose 6-phosphate 1-phosphotransferase subunit beta-like [Vicia villosa]